MSWLFGLNNEFDEVLEKATSEMIPSGQEDMALNLDICDRIRGKSIAPKEAMRSLKKRLSHRNPNVQLLTLKNGGAHFLQEVASREFMDHCVSIISNSSTNPEVTRKLLGLLQSWSAAFASRSELSYVADTCASLRAQGIPFPPAERTEAIMIDTSAPPDWTDSDVCERCRTLFTLTNRKHHCRACGKTFCNPCSSRQMALPELGIVQNVRVCETCFLKKNPNLAQLSEEQRFSSMSSSMSLPSSQQRASLSKEEEELERAIALSLAESQKASSPAKKKVTVIEPQPSADAEEQDPDLAAAIAASLAEMQVQKPAAKEKQVHASVYPSPHSGGDAAGRSATSTTTSRSSGPAPAATAPIPSPRPEAGSTFSQLLSSSELENISLFHQVMEKMDADSTGASSRALPADRDMRNLCDTMTTMHPKLVKMVEECVERHRVLMDLHEKLTSSVRTYNRLVEERQKEAEEERIKQEQQELASRQQQHQQQVSVPPPVTHPGYYAQHPPVPPQHGVYYGGSAAYPYNGTGGAVAVAAGYPGHSPTHAPPPAAMYYGYPVANAATVPGGAYPAPNGNPPNTTAQNPHPYPYPQPYPQQYPHQQQQQRPYDAHRSPSPHVPAPPPTVQEPTQANGGAAAPAPAPVTASPEPPKPPASPKPLIEF